MQNLVRDKCVISVSLVRDKCVIFDTLSGTLQTPLQPAYF